MTLREAYSLLGGDLDEVLERLGGNRSMLMKHLKQFAKDKPLPVLREAVIAGDQSVVWQEAHELHGTCRALGLGRLAEATERVMASATETMLAWLEREHALAVAVIGRLERGELALSMLLHELRTPLQAMMSTADAAGIERISLAARHMSVLLSGLDKPVAGTPLRWESFSLTSAMRTAVELMQGVVGSEQRNVIVRANLRHEWVLGDETGLTQILLNLLTNAARGTAENDTILLEATESNGGIALTLTDHGVGMSETQRQKACEPGWRGQAGEGMGLGLTIVHRLVERMGGDMHIDSALGKGTTVTLHLPLTPSDHAATPKHSVAHRRRFSNLRALLADDNRMNAEASAELLAGLGLRTSIARDGSEAGRLARTGGYDCVFLDAHMPGLDGVSTVKSIRQALPDAPIFGLTGGMLPGEEERFRAAGMRECLLKPVGAEKLASLLGAYFPDN